MRSILLACLLVLTPWMAVANDDTHPPIVLKKGPSDGMVNDLGSAGSCEIGPGAPECHWEFVWDPPKCLCTVIMYCDTGGFVEPFRVTYNSPPHTCGNYPGP